MKPFILFFNKKTNYYATLAQSGYLNLFHLAGIINII